MNRVSDGERIAVSRSLARQMMAVARELRTQPTSSEEQLWGALRNRRLDGAKFRRQQAIGPFVVDFFCAERRLIVEVDGSIHETQREHDEERQRLLEACGYHVVRVSAQAVEANVSSAMVAIKDALDRYRSPSPRDGEGVGG
ncbi:MAG: endonuclease domain-containing protein [Thermomicrobiales bacterium]